MDIDEDDIDLCLDPIPAFLFHKLTDVRNAKRELQRTVSDLKGFVEKLRKANAATVGPPLTVSKIWKRICNGKYVFGIQVENNSNSHISNVNCVLQWNPPQNTPLIKTQIYSTTSRSFVDTIKPETPHTVLLTTPPIDFSKHAGLHPGCQLFYTTDGGEQRQLPIGEITLAIDDFGTETEIQEIWDEVSVQAAMCALNSVRLVGKTGGDLRSFLGVEGALRAADFDGSVFVFERISPGVDGSLLRCSEGVLGVYYVDVFYRDKQSLRLILHYLHKKIEGLQLLPLDHEKKLSESRVNPSGEISVSGMPENGEAILRHCLKKQIETVEKFQVNVLECAGVSAGIDLTEDFNSVRALLVEIESRTDDAFENQN